MKFLSRYRADAILASFLLGVLALHAYYSFLGRADNRMIIAAAVIGFIPVLWSVFKSFREREWAPMDLLASVALVFSLISREWASAVFIELMLASARILADITRDRTEKSIRGLLKLRPETAKVERGTKIEQVRIEDVAVGDTILLGIGERVPVDGIVLSGSAAVDESSLTGESLPVDKSQGNKVMSSTLVQSGSLRIRATHVGKDTTLERIIRLVESAREEKPSAQTLGEKFGKIYLISVFAGSFIAYALTGNMALVLSIVLVVCADDVAIAIPIAYLRAINFAAGMGVIIKGSKHLESFGQTKTLVFDKTGTLTTGSLEITRVFAVPGISETQVIEAAALAESQSSHPFAKAVIARARAKKIPEAIPDSAEEKGGKGISAKKGKDSFAVGRRVFMEELGIELPGEAAGEADKEASKGRSVLFVAKNGKIIGFAAAADRIKENAASAISDLRSLGIEKIVMLTGDNARVAEAIAKELSIDEWRSDLMPEDKVEAIRQLGREGPVAMVGDGVNDAAALAAANVGIAMGGLGSEGTIDSAQIVLMRDDLSVLPETIRIARLVRRISVQDFWIWGATNAVGLTLVLTGTMGITGAAAYNFLSDFLPLFNSARMKTRSARRVK